MQQNKIEELKQYGFVFNGYQGFIDKSNLAQMAMDASLLTPPNSGIPVEYTAFLDPAIIRILNAPRRARKIVGERKIGDWTTPYVRFTQIEQTGFERKGDREARHQQRRALVKHLCQLLAGRERHCYPGSHRNR